MGRGIIMQERVGMEFWFLEHTLGIAGISSTIPAQKEWNSHSQKEIFGMWVKNCRNGSRNAQSRKRGEKDIGCRRHLRDISRQQRDVSQAMGNIN
jgi:hypothetical protein